MTTQDDDNIDIDSLLKRMHKMDVASTVHKYEEEQDIKDFLSQLDAPDVFLYGFANKPPRWYIQHRPQNGIHGSHPPIE